MQEFHVLRMVTRPKIDLDMIAYLYIVLIDSDITRSHAEYQAYESRK